MNFQRLLIQPRSALLDCDNWVRLQALSSISRNPLVGDRWFLEKLLEKEDPVENLLGHKALEKLLPMQLPMKQVWEHLFQETTDLLQKRASYGSTQIRTAALKALAFTSDLNYPTVDTVINSIGTNFNFDSLALEKEAPVTLLDSHKSFSLQDAFGLLLATMPIEQEATIKLISRELNSRNPDRIIPALIALQLNPSPELTDAVLLVARDGEGQVFDEAVRALLACGGKKACLVITSLLTDVKDSERLIAILSVAGASDKAEFWPTLVEYAKSKEVKVALAALRAIDGFVNAEKVAKLNLYAEVAKSKEPEIMALAAVLAWKQGSLKTIKVLNQFFDSDSLSHRLAAATVLAEISPEKAIPMILSHFEEEADERVINQMFISLRKLFPEVKKTDLIEISILPWLTRLLCSSDSRIRSQAAVLGGALGQVAEETLAKALGKEESPYVIATLIAALGKTGSKRLLLFTKFHDNPDSRVRANMVYALGNCGSEAILYFTEALSDSSPRVRAGAAYNLFLLGQLESIKVINSMLQVPDPLTVLSACHVVYQLRKLILQSLDSDHPLLLAIGRLATESQKDKDFGPGYLNVPEAPEVFNELASCNGDRKKMIWILEEKHKRKPSLFLYTRLLAALYILTNDNQKALPLIEICIRENPHDLADLLDAYRTAMKLGNLNRTNEIGAKTKKLYNMLLEGCIELCRTIDGDGAALMLQRLNFLTEPSMNLYNSMIQLKVIEKETETVIYLMSELILARPFNTALIRKLVGILPSDFGVLGAALSSYVDSLEN